MIRRYVSQAQTNKVQKAGNTVDIFILRTNVRFADLLFVNAGLGRIVRRVAQTPDVWSLRSQWDR